MSAATQRAGWSRLPLRAAAFVVLTCATILGVSAWREWAARDAVLKGAETEMANVARSLTQHAEDSLDLLDSGVVHEPDFHASRIVLHLQRDHRRGFECRLGGGGEGQVWS